MRLASNLKRLGIIGGIVLGASLTGTAANAANITFDFTGTVNTANPIQGFNVNIGGYTATMATSGTVTIKDVTGGHDQFLLRVNQPNGLSVGPHTVFSNNALTSTPPSLSAFTDLNNWRLTFVPDSGRALFGTLVSFTAAPLPAAVVLSGAGLVALAGLGAGEWRQRRNI
jgi:hypothetical protein